MNVLQKNFSETTPLQIFYTGDKFGSSPLLEEPTLMLKETLKVALTALLLVTAAAIAEDQELYREADPFDFTYSNEGSPPNTYYQGSEIERSLKGFSAMEMERDGGDNLATKINRFVDFGGAIEVELFVDRDYEERWRSDIVLDSAELDFEITVVDWAKGFLSFEWEDEEELVSVKEAFVLLGGTKCYPFFVLAGRVYVPFGIGTGAVVGDTLSVSDPLTIDIFETREDVVILGTRWNRFYAGFYGFNGDTFRSWRQNHIDQYGATVRYYYERPNLSYNLGFDMISCVFDSDNLSKAFPEALFNGYAPGLALHGRYFNNGFSLIVEFNGTFSSTGFEQDGIRYKLAPKAWQVEIGYERDICCRSTYFAINFSRSYDLQGAFPKSRLLATIGRWIYKDILLAIEYGHDVDYSRSNYGTGKSYDFFVAQLAYEW